MLIALDCLFLLRLCIVGAVLFSAVPLSIYVCLEEGMIFHSYYRFILAKLYYQVRLTNTGVVYYDKRRVRTFTGKLKRYAFKVLGGCVFCYGFWLSLIQALFYFQDIIPALITAFGSLSFMYFFVFKAHKK